MQVNKFESGPPKQVSRSWKGSSNIYKIPPNTHMGPGEHVISTHVMSKDVVLVYKLIQVWTRSFYADQ